MAHLKRYSMPKIWRISRKKHVWIGRPMPGPHPRNNCITLQVLIRDILKYAETRKEAKKIISEGKVLVDKRVIRNLNFPVGLMDVIEIPETKEYFRMIVDRRGLSLEKIQAINADKKLCRINGKATLKKGKQQLNLHDGRNILTDKKSPYRVGDSVAIALPGQEIIKHYKLEKGSPAFIFAGKNIGIEGKIKDIRTRKNMLETSTAILSTKDKEIETLKDYVFPGELSLKGLPQVAKKKADRPGSADKAGKRALQKVKK